MASYYNLTLDTLYPQNATLKLNGGALTAGSTAITAAVGTSDASTAGYTMKFYGDIYDASFNSGAGNPSALTESQAVWETFSTTKNLVLLGGDGLKTVRMKLRDDVHNATGEITATITLDTSVPTATITGPDVSRISEQPTKNTSTFTFIADKPFLSYRVMLVPGTNAEYDNQANVLIPVTAGSVNMSGNGTYPANAPIESVINGTDLKTAAGGSDGAHIVKVFVMDGNGWSV
ncbi:MAG: hypothetical protein FWF08_00585 [Oscillospiraceae bacterium]|nr:hypothetical protein [Oscillospiraceae bacterium]